LGLHEKSGSPFLTQAFFLSLFLFGSKNPKYIFEILRCAQNDKMKWIPAFVGMTGGSRPLRQTKPNHRPVILNTTRTPKRPSKSTAALNIRMSCVLGSKSRQTKAQSATISNMRKTKYTMSPNINIQ
jgi:hypothetical protein